MGWVAASDFARASFVQIPLRLPAMSIAVVPPSAAWFNPCSTALPKKNAEVPSSLNVYEAMLKAPHVCPLTAVAVEPDTVHRKLQSVDSIVDVDDKVPSALAVNTIFVEAM
jgi:hypothetical protein